jgi:uncharacterized protein (PEP-CTERM system associated)
MRKLSLRPRRLTILALGCGVLPLLAAGGRAQAQGVAAPGAAFGGGAFGGGIGLGTGILPATGFGNALPNLADFINTPLAKGGTQLFTFGASLGVQAGYTDNAGGVASNQHAQGSFEGRVSPTLSVFGNSRRVDVSLTYDPTVYYYPQYNTQSRIDQNLSGAAQVELADQLAYVDLNAYASETPNNFGYGPANGSAVSRQQLNRLYNVSINPYLVHQFGGFGSGKLSYTLGESIIQTGAAAVGGAQNTRSMNQSEDALFTSGEDFGQWNHGVELNGQQTSGTGALASSYRYQATYTLGYALNRFVALNAKIGYEDLHYSSVFTNGVQTERAYNLTAPLGSAGVTLTPNQDSSLALSYGYIDGGTTLSLNATYKPTERLTLYATSSSGVTTNLQQLQNYAATAQTTVAGVQINPVTGAPIQFTNGNSNTSNAVYRTTQSSLTGVFQFNRDSVTLGIAANQNSNPGQNTGGNVDGSTVYGTAGWQHELSESLTSLLTGTYGVSQQAGQGSSSFIVANATLTKTFTETLSGTANYSLYRRVGTASNPGTTVNEILFGLLQKF